MKILTPILIAVLTFPMGAQEEVKPVPPVRKAPPARTEGKTGTSSVPKNNAATQKPTTTQVTPVPTRTGRRVVLPPNRTNSVPSVRSTTTQARTSSSNKVPPATTRLKVSPATTRLVQRPTVTAASVVPKALTENIKIHLQGTASEGTDLDLSLTGIGPLFQADVVTGDTHTILSHTYSVKPNGSGYTVEYNIGFRFRMEVARTKQSSNFEFREVSLNGTVLLTEGNTVVISKNGDQELSLSVSKAK